MSLKYRESFRQILYRTIRYQREEGPQFVTLQTMKLSDKNSNNTTNMTINNNNNHSSSQIHRIPELDPPEVVLAEEYDVEKTIAEGCFARIFLATHRQTNTTVVLKAIHEELTSLKDFCKEYHYSYTLSHHPNILSSYQVCFKADNYFCFAQEYAAFGDLAGNVKAGGLPEESCKKIALQLSSALDFMHSKSLVHRDIKLENILVFSSDFSRIKLCDFGSTVKEGTLVNRIKCTWISFLPPEIYEIIRNERYICKPATDVWQLGIVLFVCLTGNPPWQFADSIRDVNYSSFFRYQKRRSTKIPTNFKRFSPRMLRMFRKMLEHKPDKRAQVTEINKYIKNNWLDSKIQQSNSGSNIVSYTILKGKESWELDEQNGDSKNSLDENKNKLKKLLSSYGLETTVDQRVMTKRVWDWVLSCDSNNDTDMY